MDLCFIEISLPNKTNKLDKQWAYLRGKYAKNKD